MDTDMSIIEKVDNCLKVLQIYLIVIYKLW